MCRHGANRDNFTVMGMLGRSLAVVQYEVREVRTAFFLVSRKPRDLEETVSYIQSRLFNIYFSSKHFSIR
jgi:hypothetical protein